MANAPLVVRWGSDITQVVKGAEQIKISVGEVGSRLGTAMKVGATAGISALAGFATAAVKSFGDFEQGMNEVRTLLPELGEAGFNALKGDVISLSKEMGLATDQVIPALYQSISAGVPDENVFGFMEVASKAAIGGVTDLETAVDGITTVVNGYGEEAISAQEAADLMFTAVKLGKTDFEQLSGALSNVTPMAAALGVGFDEVSAAMAVMTSQGVPTSVATTSLRQVIGELGKAGSQAATKFEMISGQAFPEFMRAGGSLGGALAILNSHVQANNLELQNMFGSVEAGTGALALMADDSAQYQAALEAMGGAAGSVDAAFATMDTGVNRTAAKLKSQFDAVKIQFGEALIPAMSRVMTVITPYLETFIGWFDVDGPVHRALIRTGEIAANIWNGFISVAQTVWDKIQPTLSTIWTKLKEIVGVVIEWLQGAWEDYGKPTFDKIKTFLTETLPGYYTAVIGKVKEWAGHAWESVGKPIFDAVKIFLTETLPGYYTAVIGKVKEWAGHAWDTVGAPAMDTIKGALDKVPGWYDGAVSKAKEWGEAATPGLKKAFSKETYSSAISGIGEFFTKTWGKVSVAFDWVGPALTKIGNKLAGLFKEGGGLHSMGEAMGTLGGYLKDDVLPMILKMWRIFLTKVLPVLAKIGAAVLAVLLALQPIVTGIITTAIQVLSGIFNMLAGAIQIVVGILTGDWKTAWEGVKKFFKGLLEIILAPFVGLWDALQAVLDGLIGDLIMKGWQLGLDFAQGLLDGIIWLIKEGPGALLDLLIDVGLSYLDMVSKIWEIGKEVGGAVLDGIVDFIKGAPGAILDALIAIVPSAGDVVGAITGGLKGAIGGLVDWVGGDGGIVTKPTFAMIGESGTEAVLPLTGPAAQQWLGPRGPSQNVTVNIQGDVYSGPDEFADRVVSVLRRQDRVHGQISDLSAV